MENVPQKKPTTAVQAGVDPLLAQVEALYDLTKFKQFTGGFSIAYRSVKFLMRHKELWPKVAIPAAINIILFFITAGVLVSQAGGIVDWIWTQPDGFMVILWYIVYAIIMLLMVVIAYLSMLLIGALVASPFNDMLSQDTERILKGDVADEFGSGFRSQTSALIRSIVMSLFILVVQGFSSLILGVLGLIPGVGLVTGPMAIAVSSYLLAVEYSDFPLERRKYNFGDKFKIVWKFKEMTVGFGAGAAVMLWIPLLNFLCMPIAVIGGTAVGLSLDHRKHYLSSTPQTSAAPAEPVSS